MWVGVALPQVVGVAAATVTAFRWATAVVG
jgi:hypothetical protein